MGLMIERARPPRLFTPRQDAGPYRLPREVSERLTLALAGYRNREAAWTLAVFLGRFWSSRTRLATPFPVDRRALADHDALGLSEARVRGALRVLEEVGFLNRGEPPAGSVHRMKGDELHRKPITFGFGAEYGPAFAAANARAQASRQRRERAGRAPMPASARTAVLVAPSSIPNSPKDKIHPGSGVIMGEVSRSCRKGRLIPAGEPSSALERALESWRKATGFGG